MYLCTCSMFRTPIKANIFKHRMERADVELSLLTPLSSRY